MNIVLKNGIAEAEISTLGAELRSFRRLDNGTEYIWQGDAAYWTGRSPVLFPIIGAVKDKQLKVEGQAYPQANHGFARRSEFEVTDHSDTHAVFLLKDSEATREGYPFAFRLELAYTLTGESLKIEYQVTNSDGKQLSFQLGTHPAFNCPLDSEGGLSDYELEFAENETLDRLFLNGSGLLIRGRSERMLEGARVLPLAHGQFYEDALVFRGIASRRVTLRSKRTERSVEVSFEGFPDLGVWQPKNAPFLCIEPWHGVADWEDFDGELHEKEGAVTLSPGGQFSASLTLAFR